MSSIGIISRLAGNVYWQVESLHHRWVAEHQLAPSADYYPHVTYVLGEKPAAVAEMAACLADLANRTDPYSIKAVGLGIFPGPTPVLFMPVPRHDQLNALHREVSTCFSTAGGVIDPKYQTDAWLPHVTLLSQLSTDEVLPKIVAEIQGEPLTLACQLISLCLVEEKDDRWQVVREYPFRGQNVLPENEYGLSSRPCQPADRAFIYALVEETLKPHVSAFYTWERKRFDENFAARWRQKLLILAEGRPVGYIQFDESAPDHLYVAGLFLQPAVHGRGWGRWLLRFMEQQAQDRPVRLHVWENNPALEFYLRHGYRIIQAEGHKLLLEK